jgi:hypothetical protein
LLSAGSYMYARVSRMACVCRIKRNKMFGACA